MTARSSGGAFQIELLHRAPSPDTHELEAVLFRGDTEVYRRITSLAAPLDDRDFEDLRWYLEDFRIAPFDPAPVVASRIAKRLEEIGKYLFSTAFGSDEASENPLLRCLRHDLASTRIVLKTETGVPWELLRDPVTGSILALHSRAFVRGLQSEVLTAAAGFHEGPVRILLAVCRPRRDQDIPFQSVARPLLGALERDPYIELSVLRPATYERLADVLVEAREEQRPFAIVHFDGHGVVRDDGRGYLLFEALPDEGEEAWINGTMLGRSLTQGQVPVVVLNACRSGWANAGADGSVTSSRPRAFRSLASEIAAAGPVGVVAMQYNLYMTTASQFVGDLYAGLVAGETLGVAVNRARAQLWNRALSASSEVTRTVQDWIVPIVYEQSSVAPLHRAKSTPEAADRVEASPGVTISPELSIGPTHGFHGRDDVLLKLDRAFDTESVLLLWGYAGSGKTATASAFARWYLATGGTADGLLLTSFASPVPIGRLTDLLQRTLSEPLPALEVLRKHRLLWIWDGVEGVAALKSNEQDDLRAFLQSGTNVGTRFLLTSRRHEAWLGDLPTRIPMPPMPMGERIELIRAIADGRSDVFDVLLPERLLDYSRGNPLALTVLANEAIDRDARTLEKIERYISEATQGHTDDSGQRLLAGPILCPKEAFTEDEWRRLAVVMRFQGYVNVDYLVKMSDPTNAWSPEELHGLTDEYWLDLLIRAADAGLLNRTFPEYFEIHPLFPRTVRPVLDRHYSAERQQAIARAYVEVMGLVGRTASQAFQGGTKRSDTLRWLRAEEANLLEAYRIASVEQWWRGLVEPLNGLSTLYQHSGRRGEWSLLVQLTTAQLVDPTNDGPLPSREEAWHAITEFRIAMANDDRNFEEAQRLSRLIVAEDRSKAAPFIADKSRNDGPAQSALGSLAMSLKRAGDNLRMQGDRSSLAHYKEALELFQRIGDRPNEAITLYNLALVYLWDPNLRDLNKAMGYALASVDLHDPADGLGRSKCMSLIAEVAYYAAIDVVESRSDGNQEAEERLKQNLNIAYSNINMSLESLPDEAFGDLAYANMLLGDILTLTGHHAEAFAAETEAIAYFSRDGNQAGLARARLKAARDLNLEGRLVDALTYAQRAEAELAALGPLAVAMHEEAEDLVQDIREGLTNVPASSGTGGSAE